MQQDNMRLPRRHLLQAVACGVALALSTDTGAFAEAVDATTVHPAHYIPFDAGWRFILGDPPHAEHPAFDDGSWRQLDLPHDWSIEDRPGAPKTTDPWVPPVAMWNLSDHPADAKPVSPAVPIVMASVPPPSPEGPPRKVGSFDVDATAFGWGTGWTVGGVGWYRKQFSVVDQTPGEQVGIRFDGAFLVTEVWLNGISLGRNVNGYLGFTFDLTAHLLVGKANCLAVRVANLGETARWYSGSGLYRHVWLTRTGEVYIPPSGVGITTTTADAAQAKLAVGVEIHNAGQQPRTIECRVSVRDGTGKIVGRAAKSVPAALGQTVPIDMALDIEQPMLWSPEAPNLHFADIVLSYDGKVSDKISQRFGIRTLSVSPEKGFQVNGKTYQLRGVCLHHDNGLLGAAAIDRAERRKVEIVKANGFNAIRCSHNPPSPQFLDACDELGMIVIDEAFDVWEQPKLLKDAYNVYFKDHWRTDLAEMVRRDRNHPSVAFWSIGNEIPEAATPHGADIATQMRALILEHDRSRFITHALTASVAGKSGEAARSALDVVGYNYSFKAVAKDHAAYPKLTFVTTETHSNDCFEIRQYMDNDPAYMGEFVWTGIDYIGEVGSGSSRLRSDTAPANRQKKLIFGMDVSMLNFYVWDYPAYQSGSGDIDILGQKKPPSYYRDVVWGRSPIALFVQRPTPQGFHEEQTAWGWPDELQSWTWPTGNATPMTIRVYASADEVVLLLDGNEVGRKRLVTADKMKAEFKLAYQPGTLAAVGYVNGIEVARTTLETVGAPAKLALKAERPMITDSPNDLAYVFAEISDPQGRLVPDADVALTFSVEGPARLRAAGSANPYGIESFQDNRTRGFHGKALAILQPTGRRGDVIVRVASPGLAGGEQTIRVG